MKRILNTNRKIHANKQKIHELTGHDQNINMYMYRNPSKVPKDISKWLGYAVGTLEDGFPKFSKAIFYSHGTLWLWETNFGKAILGGYTI